MPVDHPTYVWGNQGMASQGDDLWWNQEGEFGIRAVPVTLNMMWITRAKTFSCHCNSCVINSTNHILLFSFQQLICLRHLGSHYVSSDKSFQILMAFLKVPREELLHLLVVICQHLNMWEQLQRCGDSHTYLWFGSHLGVHCWILEYYLMSFDAIFELSHHGNGHLNRKLNWRGMNAVSGVEPLSLCHPESLDMDGR